VTTPPPDRVTSTARNVREHPPALAPARDGRITVGRVGAPWGLAGHVNVTTLSSNPERFRVGAELLVAGVNRRVEALSERRGHPVVRFSDVRDRDGAEALRGAPIEIEGEELPPPPEGWHYVHDMIGLTVTTVGGVDVGELVEVLGTGANDVYVVRDGAGREVLVPATAEVIREVDLARSRLLIDPLPGLLDV